MKTQIGIACGCCITVLASGWGCFHLLMRSRKGHCTSRKKSNRCTKSQKGSNFKRDMCEHEYLALIPHEELKKLRALLKRIHQQRGWSTQLVKHDEAWEEALNAACTSEGGSWQRSGNFGEGHLCPDQLQKLSMVIDRVFLAGALQQGLLAAGKQPVGFQVVEDAPGPDDWISYFDEQKNQIVLRRHRWCPACLDVSEERPMSCEGLVCTSNLEVLAHTVAHEMVHALVYNIFPAMDASSEAYLPDERHGPIFKLLNKHLYGHTIDSFKQVFKMR